MTNLAYGFGANFAAEMEMAEQASQGSGGSKFTFKAQPGTKVTFAKAGTFTRKVPDPKNPQQTRTKTTTGIEGIIVDATFERQYWTQGADGANKLVCSTIAHKTGPDDTQRSGNGKWQIPLYGDRAIQVYDPMGSRGKSCADCIACGEHGKEPGELKGQGGCGARGSIMVYETATEDQDGELQPVKVPDLVNIQTPEVSGIEFRDYMLKADRLNKQDPRDVKTLFQIQPTQNGQSNMLKLIKSEPVGPDLRQVAIDTYLAEIKQIEDEREARAAERKNQGKVTNIDQAKGKKSAKAASAPVAGDDDEYDL